MFDNAPPSVEEFNTALLEHIEKLQVEAKARLDAALTPQDQNAVVDFQSLTEQALKLRMAAGMEPAETDTLVDKWLAVVEHWAGTIYEDDAPPADDSEIEYEDAEDSEEESELVDTK